jgi:hydroxymethylglutaryl-CoA lyase
MSEFITINEVGPRDGLQNQQQILTVTQRLQLIKALLDAGLPTIEVGSFVSPKAVPAMADTGHVFSALEAECRLYNDKKADAGEHFSALVANRKGYDLAKAEGVKTINLPIAASNSMNKANIRQTNEQAMALSLELIAAGRRDHIQTVPYIATAWHCPFEGAINETVVIDMAAQFFSAGASRVVLADTIGAANPAEVSALFKKLIVEFGDQTLGAHFHDTRGFGVANAYAAVEAGIRYFDGSIAGLGGCPFAPGASGNVATEDLAVLFNSMGFTTGIDMKQLCIAAELAIELTQACSGGHSLAWLKRQQSKSWS